MCLAKIWTNRSVFFFGYRIYRSKLFKSTRKVLYETMTTKSWIEQVLAYMNERLSISLNNIYILMYVGKISFVSLLSGLVMEQYMLCKRGLDWTGPVMEEYMLDKGDGDFR